MRLKFILNAPAQLESGGYLVCLCVKGFPFVSSFAERGFPEVADWLTVQWLLVVKSWALAEVVVWLKFEMGAVGVGLCCKISF